MVHEQMQFFFRGFRRDAHPMSVLVGTVGALASFYHDSLDINDPHHREISAIRLIAKMPTLVAMAYKYSVGQPFVYPRNDLSYSANFMHMMFAQPVRRVQGQRRAGARAGPHPDPARGPRAERIDLDRAPGRFVGRQPVRLYRSRHRLPVGPCARRRQRSSAEHAQGNRHRSTRSPSSSSKVKDKNSGVKLMGFGHRVYKNFDPRAKLMRETCHEVLEELGLQDDPLFKLAMALEKIALEDEYFVSRKLYPNVDFYSGIVQSALGIPVSLFTGIFAMARTIGWIAQWNEMISDPEQKIGRPRQLFVGSQTREVLPVGKTRLSLIIRKKRAAATTVFRAGPAL